MLHLKIYNFLLLRIWGTPCIQYWYATKNFGSSPLIFAFNIFSKASIKKVKGGVHLYWNILYRFNTNSEHIAFFTKIDLCYFTPPNQPFIIRYIFKNIDIFISTYLKNCWNRIYRYIVPIPTCMETQRIRWFTLFLSL